MGASRDDAVAVTVISEHRCGNTQMENVEIVLIRNRNGWSKNRRKLEIAIVTLRRSFAQFVNIVGVDTLCTCHNQTLLDRRLTDERSLAPRNRAVTAHCKNTASFRRAGGHYLC